MDLKTRVKDFLGRFDPALNAYLIAKSAELKALDQSGQDVADVVATFAAGGGKRIRPMLVELGYCASGGEPNGQILMPAVGIELLHAFFLIHDDIMDESDLRRGQPTVHRIFERQYWNLFASGAFHAREHFAESMAILAGDLCCAMAYQALTKSEFPPTLVLRALDKMHSIVDATVVGQVLDVRMPLKREATEADVTQIQRLKTARYTFEGPLHLGMVLADATNDELEMMSRYAIPVGIAFQIQDDLLGVFGSEAEVGKSVTSDLEEGKRTLLTVFAREHGSQAQRERVANLVGKKGITVAELDEARAIFREIGAVEYCQMRARELVQEGKEALAPLNLPADTSAILSQLADYAIGRAT